MNDRELCSPLMGRDLFHGMPSLLLCWRESYRPQFTRAFVWKDYVDLDCVSFLQSPMTFVIVSKSYFDTPPLGERKEKKKPLLTLEMNHSNLTVNNKIFQSKRWQMMVIYRMKDSSNWIDATNFLLQTLNRQRKITAGFNEILIRLPWRIRTCNHLPPKNGGLEEQQR